MEEVHDDDQRVTMQHKIEIMRQVASACEALALQGIVHRHIAARNVLLSAFDLLAPSTTVANVSDFGVSVSAYRRSCLTVDGGAVRMTCMAHQSLQRKQRRVLLPRVVLRVAERWQTTFCTGSQRRSSCAHDGAGGAACKARRLRRRRVLSRSMLLRCNSVSTAFISPAVNHAELPCCPPCCRLCCC